MRRCREPYSGIESTIVEQMQPKQEIKTVSIPEPELTFTELTQLLKDMDEEIKSLMFKRRHVKDRLIKLLSND